MLFIRGVSMSSRGDVNLLRSSVTSYAEAFQESLSDRAFAKFQRDACFVFPAFDILEIHVEHRTLIIQGLFKIKLAPLLFERKLFSYLALNIV